VSNQSLTTRPAVFLDRDGTIIHEVGYLSRPEQVELLPGAIEGLQHLQQCGYALVIVSNQSGVARGYFPESAIHAVHRHLIEILEARGIHLAGMYYCPHHPEGTVQKYRKTCRCRKPEPGMVEQAVRDLDRPKQPNGSVQKRTGINTAPNDLSSLTAFSLKSLIPSWDTR